MQVSRYIANLKWSLFFLLLVYAGISSAQKKTTDVYVDKNGVMRWGNNNAEVFGFGVNYTVPFAHAYRAAKVRLDNALSDAHLSIHRCSDISHQTRPKYFLTKKILAEQNVYGTNTDIMQLFNITKHHRHD